MRKMIKDTETQKENELIIHMQWAIDTQRSIEKAAATQRLKDDGNVFDRSLNEQNKNL